MARLLVPGDREDADALVNQVQREIDILTVDGNPGLKGDVD